MDIVGIILFLVFEVMALVVIARLWLQQRHRLVSRILWSLFLLMPLFGLLVYILSRLSDMDKNPDRMDTQSDSDAFYGGSGHP